MAQRYDRVYIMSEDEYNEIINPDIVYSKMTKTLCNKAVKNILKFATFPCWHELDPTDEKYPFGDDDGYCHSCPVIQVLGQEAGERICLREKNWSK